MKRVIITGDRDWEDRQAISQSLMELALWAGGARHLLIITGGARGADTLAEEEAIRLGIHVAVVPALWDAYGRSAGPTRNAVMATLQPHRCVAFHPELKKSRGTKDMVRRMLRQGVQVTHVKRRRSR